MSAAPAATAEGDAPKKGSKKLIIIIAAVALLLVVGGGGAFLMLKKSPDATEEDGGDHEAAAKRVEPKKNATPPAFVPLDPFVVNLADRDSDRFAQVGITLQVDDPKMSEEMKAYMPAIRNAILLILSHKTSEELLSADGKTKLALEIRIEAARSMGYEVEDPEDEEAEAADEEEERPKKRRKKKKKVELYNPIVQVHYANFIIQ